MVRPNKRKLIAKKAARARKIPKEKKLRKEEKITQFVLSMYITGLPLTTAFMFCIMNQGNPPTKHQVYKKQPYIVNTLYNMAKMITLDNFLKIQPKSVVAVDGSWSQRRNAPFCIIDVIDIKRHQIVAFDLEMKSVRGRKGNYEGPSNQMEAVGFKKIIPLLKSNPNIEKIVKDGDVKLSKLIREAEWSIDELHDPNHMLKKFPKIFAKYNKLSKGKLGGLKERLYKHLCTLLRRKDTTSNKLEYWLAATDHFSGVHKNCPDPTHTGYTWKHCKDETAKNNLNLLLIETSDILKTCDPDYTTNVNENFHSVKAHLAPKLYSWKAGWVGRISAAILQYCNPYMWIYDARYYLNLPCLPPKIFKIYNQFAISRIKQNAQRRTQEAKDKSNKLKYEKRRRSIKDSKIQSPLAHK